MILRERKSRKKDLEESPAVGTKEVLDLRMLSENLAAPRSMGLVRVRPEEVSGHYSFLRLFPSDPHSSPFYKTFLFFALEVCCIIAVLGKK